VNEGHEKRILTENDVSELKQVSCKKYSFLRKIQDLTSFRSKVIDDVRTATPYKQKNVKDARSKQGCTF